MKTLWLLILALCMGLVTVDAQTVRIETEGDGLTNYAHTISFTGAITQSNASGRVFLSNFGTSTGGGTTNLFGGAGTTGLVTSATSETNKFLRGDGTWQETTVAESDPVWSAASNLYLAVANAGNLAYSNAATFAAIVQNPTNLTAVIPFTKLPDTIPTNVTVSAGSVAYDAGTRTFSITLPTLAGDVTGAIGSSTVGKLHGRTVNDAAPNTGDVLYWNGSQWSFTNATQIGSASSMTNLGTSLPGWAAFPDIGSTAYPAGSNGREGAVLPDNSAAVVWTFDAPEHWTGTNWQLRGSMRFPVDGAMSCTVDVQAVGFASGSSADPTWTSYPTQQLVFASSGDASNRVMLTWTPTSLFTNVQPGQRVYVRGRRQCTGATTPWLTSLGVLNQ